MDFWRSFWTLFCAVGFTAFFVMFVCVVPRGARQLRDLFAKLNAETDVFRPEAGDGDPDGEA